MWMAIGKPSYLIDDLLVWPIENPSLLTVFVMGHADNLEDFSNVNNRKYIILIFILLLLWRAQVESNHWPPVSETGTLSN